MQNSTGLGKCGLSKPNIILGKQSQTASLFRRSIGGVRHSHVFIRTRFWILGRTPQT